MNDTTLASRRAVGATERVARLFAAQQAAFNANPYPPLIERRTRLKALKNQLRRYQDLLADAASKDFGFRSPAETRMLDVLSAILEINHALGHVRKWMKPSRRSTELLFMSNSLRVEYQPKGVVGVIVPWNFPIYLAMGPITAALAAGNRVMVKMPEVTPVTNAVIARLLGEVFTEEQVAVVGEELVDPNVFTSLPFNHIVFTGSPAVGKIVMRTAADNLTPVTLELGGKSPAVVTRNYSLREAATRIVHGKGANAGQICVSPDYALVPRESLPAFVDEVKRSFHALYGDHTDGNHDYTAVVNERQHRRLLALLDDARAKGATVISCATMGSGRQMPLHVVTGCTEDMLVMKEEIFGPVLAVLPYDTMDEVVAQIQSRPRPLAMYCFGHDASERQDLLRRTHAGGVTVNDWGWHLINHDAPFGGTGNSGMGNYHGEEGFRELSHAKTVFKRHRFFPIGLFYPPYGTFVQRLVMKVFVGDADDSLKAR
ncbi:coniferyl aldehyde dehydrogenase [Variovorax rhizosphaerae]|uniref:Aldehyde dehydrogenase n=1 Tax=Variovorax rhizosphaerae TaxID=1836200 RepID=A0ABU8WGC5_9BURK